MKEKKKGNPWRMAYLLGAVVLGVVIGFRQDTFAYECVVSDRKGLYYLVSVGALLSGTYLHVLIHEAGHLVCGLLSGYRFSSFRIGSYVLLREQGKMVLRRYWLPGTAGQCLMAPPPMTDGEIPVILYNLGGAIANALWALVCFILAWIAPRAGAAEWMLGIWGFLGLILALSNAIPRLLKVGGNDGHNTRSLLNDPAARRGFWLQMAINDCRLQGQTLLQMPEEWFAMPEPGQMQNAMTAVLAIFHADRLMEEGKEAEGQVILERLLEEENAISPANKAMVRMSLLWREIMGENRPEVVASLRTKELKRVMKLMKNFPEVIRMEYALAVLVDHEPEKARKCLARFGKVAHNYVYRQTVEQERRAIGLVAEKKISSLGE